jgi:hypothetical protein
MKIRSIGLFFLAAVAAVQFGCGGGGGGGPAPVVQPTKAIVKLETGGGTLPSGTFIGGIGPATVTYPTTKGLSITDSNVVTSGAGVGAGSFLQPNVTVPGQVRVALINVSPGILSGEFATLTFSIASGNSPVAGDFTIAAGAPVIDTNSAAIPGFTVSIKSVEFQ